MEGVRPERGRAIVYCVVPRDLSARLLDPLRRHFREQPGVRVLAERRREDRRHGDRRGAPAISPNGERRLIARKSGRRVAERRAITVPVGPPPLPRRARRFAERLSFVERLEPARQTDRDIDADRLVLRYQSGDESAFSELYMRYFDLVYGYARVALREHHEAEDVTQQVFANVIRAAPGYEVRSDTPFRAWLLQITRNHVIDVARRKRRLVLEDPARVAERNDGAGQDPEQVLHWLSDQDVSIFVERLPEAQREVLVLRYMLDLPAEEVAALVGRSADSVRRMQSRALRSLEQRLRSIGRTPLRSRRAATLSRIKPAPVLAARRFALSTGFRPAGRLVAASTRAPRGR